MITQQRSRKRPLIPTSKQDSRTNKSKQPSTRTRSHNTILIVELLDMKAHLLERRRAFGRLSRVYDRVRIRVRIRARVRGVRQHCIPPRGPRARAKSPARCPCTASPSVLSQYIPARILRLGRRARKAYRVRLGGSYRCRCRRGWLLGWLLLLLLDLWLG